MSGSRFSVSGRLQRKLEQPGFPYQIGIPVYFFSYFQILLLGDTHFWDDWAYQLPKSEFAAWMRLSGFPPTRELVEFDLLGNSGLSFRIATFAAYFAGAICLHSVLRQGLHFSNAQVNITTLLFLVLPINSARASMIIFHYSLSLLVFYIGWAFLVSKHVTLQLVSIIFFWWSFGTISLLPFFLLPLMHWAYLNRYVIKSLGRIAALILLIFLPIGYWTFRAQTFGSAIREYYDPRLSGLIRGGILLFITFAVALFGLKFRNWSLANRSQSFVMSLGSIALALGAFAYIAGGHLVDISDWLILFVPNFSDWDSRHQLLLGLGFSLIIGSTLASSTNLGNRQIGAFLVILGFCLVLNFTFGQEYYLDALKQQEIVAEVNELPELMQLSAVMVDDQAPIFNARGRTIRSWEWEKLLNSSAGQENLIRVEPIRYVNCTEFNPQAILTITAQNGRFKSLLNRRLGIQIKLEKITPCS